MRILRGLLRVIDTISDISGKGVSWLALALTLALSYEVFSRYILGRPTAWAFDVGYMLGGSLFMIGAAYTMKEKAHVRVDVIYLRYPPRTRAFLDVVAFLILFFPLWGVLLFYAIDYVQFSWQIKERALESFWRPPIYPFKTVIPVAIFLLALQGVAEFIRRLYFLVKRQEL